MTQYPSEATSYVSSMAYTTTRSEESFYPSCTIMISDDSNTDLVGSSVLLTTLESTVESIWDAFLQFRSEDRTTVLNDVGCDEVSTHGSSRTGSSRQTQKTRSSGSSRSFVSKRSLKEGGEEQASDD